MRVRVLAFARLRELLGTGDRELELAEGATAGDAWVRLANQVTGLEGLRASTRFARNGVLSAATTALHDGDELALLPPIGGG